jgi:uncharacterized protein (DUF2384 family)
MPVQADVDMARLSGAGLRGFFRIAEKWGLSGKEQMVLLGVSSRTTLDNWKKATKVRLSADTLERISYVLGMFKALQVIFGDTTAAQEWIRRPNRAPLFGGKSALDRMLSGRVADLYRVRQYLDAERGAWA